MCVRGRESVAGVVTNFHESECSRGARGGTGLRLCAAVESKALCTL